MTHAPTGPDALPAAVDHQVGILLILRGAAAPVQAQANPPAYLANCEAADCIVYAEDNGRLTLLKISNTATSLTSDTSIAVGALGPHGPLTYEHFITLLIHADVIWSWRTDVGPRT